MASMRLSMLVWLSGSLAAASRTGMAACTAATKVATSESPAKKRLRLFTVLRMASGLRPGAVLLLGDGVLESGGDGSGGGAGLWRLPPPALCLEGGESTISRLNEALGTVSGLSGSL